MVKPTPPPPTTPLPLQPQYSKKSSVWNCIISIFGEVCFRRAQSPVWFFNFMFLQTYKTNKNIQHIYFICVHWNTLSLSLTIFHHFFFSFFSSLFLFSFSPHSSSLHFISFHFTFHFISLHFFSLLIPLNFILHISLLLILLPRVHWLLCSACLKHLKLQVHLNEMIWKQACLLRLSSSSRRRQEDDIVVRAPDKLASAQTIWGRMWTSLPPLTPVSCIMYHYSGFICVYSQ